MQKAQFLHPRPGNRIRKALAVGVAAAVTALIVAAAGAANAATLLSDDFADGNANGWSTSGGSWSVTSGTYTQSSTSASGKALADSPSWSTATVSAKVRATAFGTATSRGIGIAARVQSTSNFYALLLTPNSVQIRKGTTTTLASAPFSPTTGTWYTLALSTTGSSLVGTVNGTPLVSTSDTSYATGRAGLLANYTAGSFDDVLATDAAGPTPTTPPTTSKPPTTPPTTTPTSSPPTGEAIYVAPTGTDSGAGTQSDPTTLPSAIGRVNPGGTIYMRGGTYRFSQTITIGLDNNGTASARKNLYAYPGETPVLNFSAQTEDPANRGLAVGGSYWHIYGIVVEHAGDNGILLAGNNNIIERTITRFNRDTGLQLSRLIANAPKDQWPSNNLVLSAESHDNADSDGEDADGFAAKLTVGPGNVFRYTVSHNNIDDGYDLFTKPDTGPIGAVTIEDSLAYDNGTLSNGGQAGAGDRNGYKLGGDDIPVNHVVRRDIAFHNGKHGFTYNRNPGTMQVSNNISIANTQRNFNFEAGSSVFRNNTSCDSAQNDRVVGDADGSNQFWSGTNGSRCASLSGELTWAFASDGRLVVTIGGRTVTPLSIRP